MFRKILARGIGGSIIGGGLYVAFTPKKVNTGDYFIAPKLTQA